MQQDSIHTDDTTNTHKIADAVAQEAKDLQNHVLTQSGGNTEYGEQNKHRPSHLLDLQEIVHSITQETAMLEKVRDQEQEHFEGLLKETSSLRQKLNKLLSKSIDAGTTVS